MNSFWNLLPVFHFHSAMPSAPPVAGSLLAPVGIAGDAVHAATASVAVANTSIGREVEFWFDDRAGLLVLHTSNLETPDPYDGRLIQFLPEVICSHGNLVLLRIRSTHSNFPTDYFVYSFPSVRPRGADRPLAVRLPDIVPEISSARSVGILCAKDGSYVVANLRLELNTKEAFLDCFCSSSKNTTRKWSQTLVKLPFPKGKEKEYMCGWHTDLVIPFKGCMLWVDLCRGFLRCSSLLSGSGAEDTRFDYVPLPQRLQAADENNHLKKRPHPYRSISCSSNGELMLIDLRKITGHNTTQVAIWTLRALDGRYWNKNKKIPYTLSYGNLWPENFKLTHGLEPLWCQKGNHMPCFPVLMKTEHRYILYLTVPGDGKAWLLRFDLQTRALSRIIDYPGFYGHEKAPYPSYDLAKYLQQFVTI